MDFPSPRGVHVPEAYYVNDPDDPYRRPPSHRNRYTRTAQQTPHIKDVSWISSPNPVAPSLVTGPSMMPRKTPQTRHDAPLPPRLPSPQVPPTSPAPRPPSSIPPSPAPTVGEHMNVDDFPFVQDNLADPYRRPRRPNLIKSFWKGFKKLSGLKPSPSFPMPGPSSHASHTIEMPIPGMSVPSEATQYVNPTPPETSETAGQRSATPHTSPYTRPASVAATPVRSIEIPPPITAVSPSPPPNSIHSVRMATTRPVRRSNSVGFSEPVGSTEGASRTLHEHVYPNITQPTPISAAIPITRSDDDDNEVEFPFPKNVGSIRMPVIPAGPIPVAPIQALQIDHSSPKSLRFSTMARFRRFVAELDDLPWVADAQIADEYIPERNPRSRMRTKVRRGAEPSWYNPRPEVVARHEYWSEWDMWAKQSTAAMWNGTAWGEGRLGWAGIGAGGGPGQRRGQWGPVYPHGYAPVQPNSVYRSEYPLPGVNEHGHAPMIP